MNSESRRAVVALRELAKLPPHERLECVMEDPSILDYCEWLCRIADAAEHFHEVFWNPYRSGRAVAMTADVVAEAYGDLRYALHYEPQGLSVASNQESTP